MPIQAATLLVVEDEFVIRMLLAETLADYGYTVVEAANAKEALAALNGDPAIAMMLTDLSLPGGTNGLELSEQAREMVPGLPVVFLTGRPDTLDEVRLAASDAVVGKPYLPSEVVTIVERLLSRPRHDS